MSKITSLSWDLFRAYHPDDGYRKAFEDLCKNLFARKLNIKPSALTEYHNQKGVEVEPIKINSDFYSFQSKFSDDDSVLWSQFNTSAKKTVLEYKHLTHIINYSNGISKRESKPRDVINDIYTKKGVTVEWIYGKQILELVEEEDNTDLKKKYFGSGQNLNIILPPATITDKSLSALKYQSEIVSFIGRERELSQLEEFIESKDLVQWWTIGGTGGSGKSRLALQLGRIYEAKGWHCGFISSISNLNMDTWNPEKPHLIIFDYVLNKKEDATKLIKKAIEIREMKQLSFSIRILLLERDGNEIIDILNNDNTFGPMIKESLFNKNALELEDFKYADLEKMLQDFLNYQIVS